MPWAELTDVRCCYQSLGQGEPVLLIAGLGRTAYSWDPIIPALAERFCVVAADTRGLGGSRPRRTPTHLSHYTADLLELIDHLQLERVHVVGISWGGVIAHRFAADHPTRVDRLVLISTAHRFSPYLREMGRLVGYTLRKASWAMCMRTLEILGSSPTYLDADPAGIDQRVQEKAELNVSRDAVAQQLHCLMTCDTPDTPLEVPAPTLVVAGEFDPLIPHCYSRETARTIPGSRFVLLDDVGHNPVAECPERLLGVMVPFLERSEPEVSASGLTHPRRALEAAERIYA